MFIQIFDDILKAEYKGLTFQRIPGARCGQQHQLAERLDRWRSRRASGTRFLNRTASSTNTAIIFQL